MNIYSKYFFNKCNLNIFCNLNSIGLRKKNLSTSTVKLKRGRYIYANKYYIFVFVVLPFGNNFDTALDMEYF